MTQLPSGALFSFVLGRVSLQTQSTKQGCPFFPWPLGICEELGILLAQFGGTCMTLALVGILSLPAPSILVEGLLNHARLLRGNQHRAKHGVFPFPMLRWESVYWIYLDIFSHSSLFTLLTESRGVESAAPSRMIGTWFRSPCVGHPQALKWFPQKQF